MKQVLGDTTPCLGPFRWSRQAAADGVDDFVRRIHRFRDRGQEIGVVRVHVRRVEQLRAVDPDDRPVVGLGA